jgi:hypothetical protein
VKKITVSVPDDVPDDVERLTGRMDEFTGLEALQHEVQAEIRQFSAADRLSREVLSEDMGDGQDYAGVRVTNPFR